MGLVLVHDVLCRQLLMEVGQIHVERTGLLGLIGRNRLVEQGTRRPHLTVPLLRGFRLL